MASKRAAATAQAGKLLMTRSQLLEASVVLLPDALPRQELDAAKEALYEASAILCDAAKTVTAPAGDA